MSDKTISQATPRCSTGVGGLDDILCGGLPCHRLYLIQGDPGVGKTTLAMQFLLEGRDKGEKVLYITLSETMEELEMVAKSHEWDLSGVELFELSAIEQQLQGQADTTFFHPSEVELNRVTQTLLDEVKRVNPDRLIFDSLSEMRMLADTALRYRKQILQLKQFFAGRKCTVILLDDRTSTGHDLQVESIAHGVISLKRISPEYGVARRQINITKIRGSKFREGNHDVALKHGGMVVFPRLITAEFHKNFPREEFPSGIPALDSLLGGGITRGTSNMFMGPPGTGKSTLSILFAKRAADRGEKVFFFSFDETTGTILARAESLGMDLRAHIENGLICLEQIDPAELSPGELAHRIQRGTLDDGVRMVIIDSINGYLNAMPEERYLNLQLHELLSFLNQQGVITIMVLAQQGLLGNMQSSVDLTYLADTVLMMRFFEAQGAVRQAVSVIKKRSGGHERYIREVRIDGDGIHVGKPLSDMQGVLTGLPTLVAAKIETSP